MLDVGVEEAFRFLGCSTRVVGYCERDAYAAGILLARMEESALEPAPIWCGNIEQLPCDGLHGVVDCIVAGFPCQPWSAAGKREGTSDHRWIFDYICDIARKLKPEWLVFENVRGLITGQDDDDGMADEAGGGPVDQAPDGFVVGIANVLRSLADLGYDAEWGCLSAGSVGASHKRERVFIVGRRVDHTASPRRYGARERAAAMLGGWECVSGSGCEAMGNTTGAGPEESGFAKRADGSAEGGAGEDNRLERSGHDVADAGGAGREGRLLGRGDDPQGREEQDGLAPECGIPLFAPGPSDQRWAGIIERFPHLAPATESGLRVVADGMANSLVCPICNWPQYVREWREGIKHALIYLCGQKTSATRTASESVVPDLRNIGSHNRRPSSRHSRSPDAGDLRVPQMPYDAGCCHQKKEAQSRHAVPELRKGNEGAESENQVLLSSLRDPIQSKVIGKQLWRDEDNMPCVPPQDLWKNTSGAQVLQSQLCNHKSKFAIDESRNDQLRAIGNGVVPLQSAACVVELLRRMMG